jgi:hypothetical protein
MSTASRVMLAEGASDATRGIDAANAARLADRLGEAVATAGARDMSQAADLLAESEDLAVQSAIVSAMSVADLDRGMELASVAGQLEAASDMMGTLGMPVLAAFLDAKGEQVKRLAVNMLLRAGATRALGAALAETGVEVGDLGANEFAKGITRLAQAQAIESQSQQLARAGAELTEKGVAEMAVSQEARQAAQEMRAEGEATIATGAEEVGAAETMEAVVNTIK